MERVNKAKAILKNKNGSSYMYAIVIVLIMLILYAVVSESFRLNIIAKGVRDNLESAIISVVTDNWNNTFNGTRQSYGGAYTYDVGGWIDDYSNGDLYNDLIDTLGMDNDGAGLTKFIGDTGEFYLSDIEVDVANASLGNDDEEFIANVKAKLTVPLDVNLGTIENIIIDIQTEAKLRPKF